MILDLPKLFRRDRPQVHSPFGDISNMPHKIDHGVRMPSFDAMAADLDNSNSRSDSSLTLRGSVQPSYTSWTAEVGGSPEFSKFSFPSPSKIRWRAVDDLDTCTLFSEGDSGLPPKATYLFSLDEVHKVSYRLVFNLIATDSPFSDHTFLRWPLVFMTLLGKSSLSLERTASCIMTQVLRLCSMSFLLGVSSFHVQTPCLNSKPV
jgi:hypothetical protein